MARGRKRAIKPSNMKRANGSGSVYQLTDKPRRKPWTAQVSTGVDFNPETNRAKQVRKRIGYYKTEDEARAALHQYLNGDFKENIAKTFSTVYAEFLEDYSRKVTSSVLRTIKSAYNHSERLWGVQFQRITPQMLKETCDAEESAVLGTKMKSLYNLMWDFAVLSEYVEVNKARQFTVERPKVTKTKKVFTAEHIKMILDNPDLHANRMIILGLYTGLRPQEICKIERKNVHIEEGYIIAGMKTEAGTDRYVPLHPAALNICRQQLEENPEREYLFVARTTRTGSTLTYDKYRNMFRNTMRWLNAEGMYSPLCTRHTFITRAKECGMDEYAIKKIIGHAISDVTEAVYTHRAEEFLQEQMALFSY